MTKTNHEKNIYKVIQFSTRFITDPGVRIGFFVLWTIISAVAGSVLTAYSFGTTVAAHTTDIAVFKQLFESQAKINSDDREDIATLQALYKSVDDNLKILIGRP
jgi:hypothetical protein